MEKVFETWQEVIEFWFETISPKQWWYGGQEFDRAIEKRFKSIHLRAAKGELYAWRESAQGALAEVLLLDQIPRHIYRGRSQAYAYDGQALMLSQVAIAKGQDQELSAPQQQFLYMPWLHSESLFIQEQAVALFKQSQIKGLQSALKHWQVIQTFGRFPHRNEVLGRESTECERIYLEKNPNPF